MLQAHDPAPRDAIDWDLYMIHMKNAVRLACLLAGAMSVASALAAADNEASDSAVFACADSLDRADGQPRASTFCEKASQYCYEASGGAALSHGAECRPLPGRFATCRDIELAPGGSCSGDASSGIHIRFAFP